MHKPNPVGGQGGNGAIESAAELINGMIKRKHYLCSLEAFSAKDVEDVFYEMQSKRHERAQLIVFTSHLQPSLIAYEKPGLSKFVSRFPVPLQSDETSLALFGLSVLGASSLEVVPRKNRPRTIPYRDGLLAPPLEKAFIVQLSFLS
jgi:hypothetical protein